MKPTFAEVMDAVRTEALTAMNKYPPFHGLHEAFAVMQEEVDELWDEVKVKQGKRDVEKVYREAVQVAAMAIRLAVDCCRPGA